MLNLLTKIKDRTIGLVDIIFSKAMDFLEMLLTEVSGMVDWLFRVGIRVCALYILYELAFKDLLDKILNIF